LQVVDTVELFHFKRQRKLSLRFLAAYLLATSIQKDTHDSIVDARTALQLFQVRLPSKRPCSAKIVQRKHLQKAQHSRPMRVHSRLKMKGLLAQASRTTLTSLWWTPTQRCSSCRSVLCFTMQ